VADPLATLATQHLLIQTPSNILSSAAEAAEACGIMAL
jgi:hypothetical protein